jgi:hypothetical protein
VICGCCAVTLRVSAGHCGTSLCPGALVHGGTALAAASLRLNMALLGLDWTLSVISVRHKILGSTDS